MFVLFTELINTESVVRRVVEACCMISSVLFIFSLLGLKKANTSRRGVFFGICGMLIAIGSTIFLPDFHEEYLKMVYATIPGAIIGVLLAFFVKLINVPQMIASLHSFVGIAATLVGFSNYYLHLGEPPSTIRSIETYIGIFVGVITFAGSVIAAIKLAEIFGGDFGESVHLLGWARHGLNIAAGITTVVVGVLFCKEMNPEMCLYINVGLGIFIGCHMVLAVGGADMPVIISMLNSYSGWATAASGFLLNSHILIIAGAVIGSSGAILSYIMCAAMNRSFLGVLLTKFSKGKTGEIKTKAVNPVDVAQATEIIRKAQDIIIVPGYGMAAANAENLVGAVANTLIEKGKKVRFCLHPVAGRMPGHMDVLLCAAGVPFKYMKELNEINKDFKTADLAIVVGCNDIVNPAANSKDSVISGMVVCEVWEAKNVLVIKRKREGTGFAGIDNEMFDYANTFMLLMEADKAFKEIHTRLESSYDPSLIAEAMKKEEKKEAKKVAELKQDYSKFEKVQIIGVPKEITKGESRVALTPNAVKKLREMKFGVKVENNAGKLAQISNEEYVAAGAEIVDAEDLWNDSNIIIKIQPPIFNTSINRHEAELIAKASLLVCYYYPEREKEVNEMLQRNKALSVWSMNNVPRISNAQKLDTMSSTGNLDGYRVVVEAFKLFKGFARGQVTAAGKIEPAKVFVIGCGVIGLAAISTAAALGAQVQAFDAREKGRQEGKSARAEIVIDEELKMDEGAGIGGYAKEMPEEYYDKQRRFFERVLKDCDVVITTARVPGKDKLVLITKNAIRGMKKGSVVMDIIGSNCELTQRNEIIVDDSSQVTISGITSYITEMPRQASELYGTNMVNLVCELCKAPKGIKEDAITYSVNLEEPIADEAVVISEGKMRWMPYSERLKIAEKKKADAAKNPPSSPPEEKKELPNKGEVVIPISKPKEKDLALRLVDKEPKKEELRGASMNIFSSGSIVISMLLLSTSLAYSTDYVFMLNFLIFCLALITGFIVVLGVDHKLHASLMSETNAISGIIYIGAMIQLYGINGEWSLSSTSGFIALFFASINVFGGFVLTDRMLGKIAC